MPLDDVCDDAWAEKKVCRRRARRVALLRQFLNLANGSHFMPMAVEGADMTFRATSRCRGLKQQVEMVAPPATKILDMLRLSRVAVDGPFAFQAL